MSTRLTMRPSSATKAAVSGNRVLRIQKHCVAGCSKTKIMPSACGIVLRNIRPISRSRGDCATCASIL
ncbi:hypothetical protein D9M69_712180 [compost metagenome]